MYKCQKRRNMYDWECGNFAIEKKILKKDETLDLMKSHNYLCSERTLADYLRAIMKELNPEEADGYVDKMFSIDDYKIVQKIFG